MTEQLAQKTDKAINIDRFIKLVKQTTSFEELPEEAVAADSVTIELPQPIGKKVAATPSRGGGDCTSGGIRS